MRLGRLTPALGEGAVFLRLLPTQAAGPLGPWGDPDVVSFQLVASQSGRGRLGRPQEEAKGPMGFTEEQSGRESKAICSPGCGRQGAEWATGRGFQALACRATLQASLLWEWAPGGLGWGLSGLRKR